MDPDRHYVFPPFRLDPTNACLWRDRTRIALRPTPFAILQYFIEHPGQLITKEGLLSAVWANTHVSASVLKGYVQQIRKALGDEHPEVAADLNNLGALYHAQRRYDEAVRLYREALTIARKRLGNDHPHVRTALSNLDEAARARREP